MEATDLNSSNTGKPLPPPVSHEEEKSEDPKASDMFPLGRVSDPDLNLLLRSERMDEVATEAE